VRDAQLEELKPYQRQPTVCELLCTRPFAKLPVQLQYRVCKAFTDDQVKQGPYQASSAFRPLGPVSTLTHLGQGLGTNGLAQTSSCDIVIFGEAHVSDRAFEQFLQVFLPRVSRGQDSWLLDRCQS